MLRTKVIFQEMLFIETKVLEKYVVKEECE